MPIQVSPLNLFSVRVFRAFTFIFAAFTFVWWVLMLVSIFVTPPGMSTRGSGFTDFSYTTLTVGNLLIALIFFTGPTKALRINMGIIAFLLFVDVILIAAVAKIRSDEGWPGVVSAIWALLVAIWCVITDRIVAWGKKEEEERLTGRAETRKTLLEWLAIALETLVLVVFIAIVLLMTLTLILRAIDSSLEADGKLYDIDGGNYRVHLDCVGDAKNTNGTKVTTVLLEAGELPSEGRLDVWAHAAYKNGTIDRYCYWDRPGYAWSDNAPSPHSAGMSADALSEALALAGETGPWISVSAGYGSTVGRIWAARNHREVTGIMLVDPLHEDLLHRVGNPLNGFTLWGYGILSPLGVQRLAGAIFYGRFKEDRVYGRSVWQTGRFLKAKLQENLVADSLTKSEVATSRTIQSAKTPLVLVSSGVENRRDEEWERKQRDLSKLTDNLVAWDQVEGAPHEVWTSPEGSKIMTQRLRELLAASK